MSTQDSVGKMITEPKVIEALWWIVGILEKYQVPYQISGGVAARLYGATRPINDIDIDIARDGFEKIMPKVKQYIFWGPDNYKDERWDMYEMEMMYKGQEVDITAAEGKIFNDEIGQWVDSIVDFTLSIEMPFEDITLRVCPRGKLVEYKKLLSGEHQKQDVAEIS